ncbi:MAG: hypothetical protein ACYCTV_08130 [Leptospirales bacterium]
MTARKIRILLNTRVLLLCVGLLSMVAACSKTINNLSSTGFIDREISLKELVSDGMAVLPVRVNAGKSPEADFIDSQLEQSLSKRFPGIRLIGPGKILAFQKNSVEGKWFSGMVEHSSPHTIRGVNGMRTIAKKMGVRYFLQTDIRISSVEGGAEHVRIYGRLWDGRSKEIVWNGYGEARGYVYVFFPAIPAPFEKDASVAVNGLVNQIPVR